jgi:hypothetical protein
LSRAEKNGFVELEKNEKQAITGFKPTQSLIDRLVEIGHLRYIN